MYCNSGFVEDVTIREDSPSSQSDDSGPAWGPLEAAFGLAPEEVGSTKCSPNWLSKPKFLNFQS